MFIRPICTADAGELHHLAEIATAEGFKFVQRLLHDVENESVAFDDRGEFFLCVIDGGEIIAVGGVTLDPYVRAANVGRIRHVYVHPQHRAKSVGRYLLREIERRAKAVYATLRLRTDTEAGARFYEALGYRRVNSSTATHTLP
jgi:GNAT superfamily N-acetyltransferase